MTELGLFPLSLVLLPTEQVPLHIFEDRYQELIGECLEQETEFGLLYADDDGLREIGTRAAVIEVITRFEDGRLNIVVEGRERFRLARADERAELSHGRRVAARGRGGSGGGGLDRARARPLLRPSRADRERGGGARRGPPLLSFALAARVELAAEVKLELLAEVSERSPAGAGLRAAREAAVTVRGGRRAAERAATNGRVQLE